MSCVATGDGDGDVLDGAALGLGKGFDSVSGALQHLPLSVGEGEPCLLKVGAAEDYGVVECFNVAQAEGLLEEGGFAVCLRVGWKGRGRGVSERGGRGGACCLVHCTHTGTFSSQPPSLNNVGCRVLGQHRRRIVHPLRAPVCPSWLAHFPAVCRRAGRATTHPIKRTLMSLMISMAWSRARGSTGSLSLARSSTSARLTRRRRGRPSVAMMLVMMKGWLRGRQVVRRPVVEGAGCKV